jgi:hypothetical protein
MLEIYTGVTWVTTQNFITKIILVKDISHKQQKYKYNVSSQKQPTATFLKKFNL